MIQLPPLTCHMYIVSVLSANVEYSIESSQIISVLLGPHQCTILLIHRARSRLKDIKNVRLLAMIHHGGWKQTHTIGCCLVQQ